LFPVLRFMRSRMVRLELFAFFYASLFLAPWFWGLFAIVFFDYGEFGSLSASGALLLVVIPSMEVLSRFDARTIEALSFAPAKIRRTALEQAKQDFSMGGKPANPTGLDAEMEAEIAKHSLFFQLAVKGQLYISSLVSLEFALIDIDTYLTANGIRHEFLERATGWNSKERVQIFDLLAAIHDATAQERARGEEEAERDRQAAEEQQKALVEYLDTLYLDPEEREEMEQNQANLLENIRETYPDEPEFEEQLTGLQ